MEDNREADQDAHGDVAASAEQQSQNVENQTLNDVEVDDNLIKPADGENSAGSLSQNAQPSSELQPEAKDDKCQEELNVEVAENGHGEADEEDEEGGRRQELMVITQDQKGELNENGAIMEIEGLQGDVMEELKTEPDTKASSRSFLLDADDVTGDESGTEEEQAAFMKELETFHRERCLDFKPPKFYQEPLNCLKLWRAVIRLGGYEQVTSLKLWRQVGESFKPPKTCTTVSWTFRGFYEKALLEYEKYKMRCGELPFTDASISDPAAGSQYMQVDQIHAPGSGRARRDAAARAMQGWHSQRLLGNGEVGDPIIKDKNPITTPKREKQLRNIGFLKRKGSSPVEHAVKVARTASKSQLEIMVVDVGVPADWVKVNVQRMKDCYEVYALVPGLLREEVRVQSDPAGRLVISGQPEQQDNPWGVTPFKKVVSLPTRIDPHQTSAVVTLHGQLFVRVPFEQSDM
ncbi:AT-rich interactive domain-containing protein 6-like isoform X1 [Salvia splendens]|uniref:AT-rich interactive domain-containing protein 6-like isoform X1 n=1 Tax=Salvia splendens TaxID=180675 RepID=UPI001C269DD1|nr:AT-rich interactive domain-containing protein 6-like isoform X1 [Salvia splendens]